MMAQEGVATVDELAASGSQAKSGTAAQEWRKGWPVVLAGMFGNGLLSMGYMSMGTFMAPLETAFHWTRTDVALGFAVYPFSAVLAPFVGMLLDARGARNVGIIGAIMSGLAFSLFATSNGSTAYWLTLWMLYASVNQFIMLTVWASAIADAFVVGRGLAMAVAMTGIALATAFVPYATNTLIEHVGWQGAFVALGLGGGGITALVCMFGIPARVAGKASPVAAAPSGPQSMTIRQALRSSAYIKIVIACFIGNLLLGGLTTHLVPVLTSDGLVRDDAVKIAGFAGLGLIVGKITSGAMLDRWDARIVSAVSLVVAAVAFVLLGIGNASASVRLAAILLFGLSSGALAPLFPYLVARIFGTASFGRLFGSLTTIYAIANALGPVGAAMVYDRAHSYSTLLLTAPISLVVALAMLLTLGKPPAVERAAG
jgi:predicted MFS family arabinose efflux permease